ncbi:TylF/MycF/NovP-related O-methyltransferase [Phaeospirillum tilakii]|uniref:TylF/MycF/NovP-related O-methyltransferase n=1 Tax=Phaeospirillum tilakii TaxID=741673 RepID=A0ABW5CCX0_9PROT
MREKLARWLERWVMTKAGEILGLGDGTRDTLLGLTVGGEGGTEEQRYRLAEALAAKVYPKYKFSELGRIFLEDEEFIALYRRAMDPDNWHSLDRKYTLYQIARAVSFLGGDAAECGVYKGGSALLLCLALREVGRTVHLFDSFEGLSAPETCDGSYWSEGALRVGEEKLRETLAPVDNYRIYRGWIPERFPDVTDIRFSFVHIDVDIYRPTLDSLSFFYDRMLSGGVILMDDYGFSSCPGAKLAADDFFSSRPERIVMLPTGQALVIKQ